MKLELQAGAPARASWLVTRQHPAWHTRPYNAFVHVLYGRSYVSQVTMLDERTLFTRGDEIICYALLRLRVAAADVGVDRLLLPPLRPPVVSVASSLAL